MLNKHGRIVSVKKQTAKKEKRLVKAGYLTKKGKFGFIRKTSSKGSMSPKKGKGKGKTSRSK